MSLLTAVWAESLKVRRSRISWISLLASVFVPVLLGLSMAGVIGDGSAYAESDLGDYLAELGVAMSIGGLIGFGFLFSWIFGREYSDRTVKDLLALPIPRSAIVVAKLAVTAAWCAILACAAFGFGCLTAWLVGIDGLTARAFADGFGRYAETVLMVIVLCIPVAWSASYGRGYLSSLGFVLLTVVVSQFGGAMGIAEYLPWAVPGLFNGAAGEAGPHLSAISLLLPYATGLAGLIGTLAWWRYADQV